MAQHYLTRHARHAQSGLKSFGARLTGAMSFSSGRPQPMHRDDIALRAIPGCLRGGDAFAGQTIARGAMRCGQSTLDLKQPSPFKALPQNHELTRHVDRFIWLADLKAAAGRDAAAMAVQLLGSWCKERGTGAKPSQGSLATTTTRLRTCLANGDLLLDECDLHTFDLFNGVLAQDVATLETHATASSTGANLRARALLALVLAGLVLDGCEDLLEAHETALAASLDQAIRPDGSPRSRCRDDAIDLVLDLIPVIRMYSYLERTAPAAMTSARQRIIRFLKTLHISGATFAGFGRLESVTDLNIARVLKLDTRAAPHTHCENCGFVRCEAGPLMVLADSGGPDLDGTSPEACASIGALEIAFAHRAVITTRQAACGNATPARHHYSTLQLGSLKNTGSAATPKGASSGALTALKTDAGTDQQLSLMHDRFLSSHGLLHSRSLVLDAEGGSMTGHERLYPQSGIVRFSHDVPLALQFQLAPEISAVVSGTAGEIELNLPEGVILVFASADGQVSLETQTDVAPDGSQRTAWLIAVRATTHGEADIRWSLTVKA